MPRTPGSRPPTFRPRIGSYASSRECRTGPRSCSSRRSRRSLQARIRFPSRVRSLGTARLRRRGSSRSPASSSSSLRSNHRTLQRRGQARGRARCATRHQRFSGPFRRVEQDARRSREGANLCRRERGDLARRMTPLARRTADRRTRPPRSAADRRIHGIVAALPTSRRQASRGMAAYPMQNRAPCPPSSVLHSSSRAVSPPSLSPAPRPPSPTRETRTTLSRAATRTSSR